MSSCVVPGCKSGYGSEGKLPPGVSKHFFPKDKKRRELWIKAIPRDKWKPSKASIVCSLHFSDDDFKTERQDSNPSRKKFGSLKRRRLKENAVPTKFPGLPSYLSVSKPKERSKNTSSFNRQQRENEKVNATAEAFLKEDEVKSFEDLIRVPLPNFPPSWNIVSLKQENQLMLEEIVFDDDVQPSLHFGLTIFDSLCFQMVSNGITIPLEKVSHINSGKIERNSDLHNLIAFLRGYSEKEFQFEDVIKSCVQKLNSIIESSADLDLVKKLTFITEQLLLSKESPRTRKYSSPFLCATMTWQKLSPVLYKQFVFPGIRLFNIDNLVPQRAHQRLV